MSGALRFVPHPQHDPLRFAGPAAFMAHAGGAGLHGGVPLLQAACLALLRHCEAAGLALAPDAAGWALAYETNIPRQRGLSGSSAIVIAALNCLLRHYGLEAAVPPAQRPRLALEAEALLGITAGLQDRVIQVRGLQGGRAGASEAGREGACVQVGQRHAARPVPLRRRFRPALFTPTHNQVWPNLQVYGGLVAMDFDERRVAREGRGRYRSLDPALLPPLWLLYRAGAPPGKHSGAVHSSVRRRWLEGDFDVRCGGRWRACHAAFRRRPLHCLPVCSAPAFPAHRCPALLSPTGRACGRWRRWRRRGGGRCRAGTAATWPP